MNATHWKIPKPKWSDDGNCFYIGKLTPFGFVMWDAPSEDVRPYKVEIFGDYGFNGKPRFKTKTEAQSYIEAEVVKQMGAEEVREQPTDSDRKESPVKEVTGGSSGVREIDESSSFENAFRRAQGEDIQKGPDHAVSAFQALSGVIWMNKQTGEKVRYSERAAGDLITGILRRGDYTDFQGLSLSKFVREPIRASMDAEGWVPVLNEKQSDQWDSAVRGPKMSNTSGTVIFKYQMPVAEAFEMRLPEGAEIIRIDGEKGMLWLWAVVNTDNPDETRNFHAFKCGGAGMDKDLAGDLLVYRGCAPIYIQAELMLYIFEQVPSLERFQ